MEDLQEEFNAIKQIQVKRTKDKKLDEFQNKLATLTFLDPACGSGNFLTETYLSLRRLENEVIRERVGGQMTLVEAHNPIKVSIQQFYGIEINDFAVTVAKTALWIAESQMLEETKSIVYGFNDDFLPLKTYVNITEGNALRLDWNEVIPATGLSYIMGNPPFVGARWMNKEQKKDMELVFHGIKDFGNLDFVTAWYKRQVITFRTEIYLLHLFQPILLHKVNSLQYFGSHYLKWGYISILLIERSVGIVKRI